MEEKVAEEKEEYIGNDSQEQVKDKINEPVAANFHPIHLHHLNQLFLFLKHYSVQKYWEEETQRNGED